MKHPSAQVYYRAGNYFLKRREFLSAINSYKDAIRLNQEYFKAYCNMGVAYKNLGLYKEAEAAFENALKIKPNSGVVFNNLGNVYTSTGRFNEAKRFYQKAIAIYPKYQEAYYNLGQVCYFTGETNRALESRLMLEKLKLKSRR